MHTSTTSQSAELIDEPALLAQRRGYARLRFSAELESGFLRYLHVKMCSRVWLVGGSCIAFMLLFVWVDLLFLPEMVHRLTVPVRLAVLMLVMFTLWYSNRPGRVEPVRAFAVSTLGYVCAGLMVVMVIIVGRLADGPIPVTHDGLYLILLAGFFLLGLPMRHAVAGSWVIVLSFVGAEYAIGASRAALIGHLLFFGSFTLIGSLGAYLYEHMLRGAYLNERLLDAARTRAERESQSKTRFLATASHDLRQPLHAMSLFVEHMDARVQDVEARRTLGRLNDSISLLQNMLSSLLDISRLSVGMVNPQLRSINLNPFLQRLLDSVEATARQRGVRLSLSCPRYAAVNSDPLLLERLIRNHVNNALMHAQASEVRIEVSRRPHSLRLAVVDDGIGLSEEEQGRIFDEFTQLRNPARSLDKGVGLGLSICRQLMHLLEYPSGVQSAPGQGARFWFDVPQAEWHEEQAGAGLMLPALRLSGRVVVVENDAISREATELLLRQWGCEVHGFECAEQAMQALPGLEVDLLLSDFHLEGSLDGLQFIRQLRAQQLYAGPALLVTADTSETLAEAVRLADVEMIYKPVLPARLRRLLQRLLPVKS